MTTDVEPVRVVDDRRTVVAALPLKAAARATLSDLLGDEVRIVDIREAVDHADFVITPACSPHTIAKLKDAYPSARLLVVELEDWDHDIDLGGPVTRSRQAGADGYLVAGSLEDLAEQLTAHQQAASELDALLEHAPAELPASTLDSLVLANVTALLEARLHRDA